MLSIILHTWKTKEKTILIYNTPILYASFYNDKEEKQQKKRKQRKHCLEIDTSNNQKLKKHNRYIVDNKSKQKYKLKTKKTEKFVTKKYCACLLPL